MPGIEPRSDNLVLQAPYFFPVGRVSLGTIGSSYIRTQDTSSSKESESFLLRGIQ
jgi:hypothetical protein